MNFLKQLLTNTLSEKVITSSGTHIEYLGNGSFRAFVNGEEFQVFCPVEHGKWQGKLLVYTKDDIRVGFNDPAYQVIDRALDNIDPATLESSIKEAEEESEWPKVISKADEFTVEMDEDEKVSIKNKYEKTLVSMPYVIWTQLARS